MVMKPKGPGGTTVALNTNAWAVAGTPHGLAVTFTSRVVLNGGVPVGSRESSTRQGVTVYRDRPPAPAGAKYPLMSITKSVASVVNTFTSPVAPAGTTTAFDRTVPVGSFSEATKGWDCPAGHAVRNPNDPVGTAAKFKEYACALAGSPQELARMGNERVLCAGRLGPPSGSVALRVSAMRHGVSG